MFAVNHTATAQQRTLDLAEHTPLAEAVEVQTILDTLKAASAMRPIPGASLTAFGRYQRRSRAQATGLALAQK